MFFRKDRSRAAEQVDACPHEVFIKGLCGNCGARLDPPQSTSVSMIHSVPELKVSAAYAEEIGNEDQERLIKARKLVLLVDLDQTVLHTTCEKTQDGPDIHSYNLWPGQPTYHTRLRPHLREFLDAMHSLYELHIFTFGCRRYAEKIATIIDPEKKYFGDRILSRDESIDRYSKKGNLNNLFPCGDAMVCIIDDRSDVWKDAANLIQVKPYSYFKVSISDGFHTPAHSSSVEDEESLERDVDKLEALLDFGEASEGEPDQPTDLSAGTSQPDSTKLEEDSAASPAPANTDLDEHLLQLIRILSHIHDKWYMELDEQRCFLAEGESYKLPDIKDIIKRYLRKKF